MVSMPAVVAISVVVFVSTTHILIDISLNFSTCDSHFLSKNSFLAVVTVTLSSRFCYFICTKSPHIVISFLYRHSFVLKYIIFSCSCKTNGSHLSCSLLKDLNRNRIITDLSVAHYIFQSSPWPKVAC